MSAGADRGAKRGLITFQPLQDSQLANKSAVGPQSSTSIISHCDSVAITAADYLQGQTSSLNYF